MLWLTLLTKASHNDQEAAQVGLFVPALNKSCSRSASPGGRDDDEEKFVSAATQRSEFSTAVVY